MNLDIERLQGVTHLVNLEEIAQKLSRDPVWIVEFLCYQLGSPLPMGEEVEFVGCWSKEELEKFLDKFIRQFVECQHCQSLKTNLLICQKRIEVKCSNCRQKSRCPPSILHDRICHQYRKRGRVK